MGSSIRHLIAIPREGRTRSLNLRSRVGAYAAIAGVLVCLIQAASWSGQFIDMGTTSLFSGINQPYVRFEALDGATVLGPSPAHNTFLLDTGATSILAVGPAAQELHDSGGNFYQGEFLEQGIGGFVPYRVSAPHSIRVQGDQGTVSMNNVRILNDPGGSFGAGVAIDGIVGMPAMVGRVTSLNMGGSAGGGLLDLGDLLGGGLLGGDLLGGDLLGGLGGDLLGLDLLLGDLGGGLGGLDLLFGDLGGLDLLGLGQAAGGFDDPLGLDLIGLDDLLGLGGGLLDPSLLGGDLGGLGGLGLEDLIGGSGVNLSVLSSVEVSFLGSVPSSGGHRYSVPVRPLPFETEGLGLPPTAAPLPVVQVTHSEAGSQVTGGSYAIDTGAQMSIISTATAASLGLDLANADSSIPLSGVGGMTSAPAFTVDRLALMTEEGVELAWNDVQVIALDIDPSLDGVIGSELFNSSGGDLDGLDLGGLLSPSAGAIEQVHFDFRNLEGPDGAGTLFVDLNSQYDNVQTTPSLLQAGDANQDLRVDQLDMVRVLQGGKYLTGQPATWGDGDWNGAPGTEPGVVPLGDGRFDQQDIIATLQHGLFNTGPYGAILTGGTTGDDQTSIVYDAKSGKVSIDAPVGVELTSINIDSAAGIFTGDSAQNLGGSFDNDTSDNIFKATFGGSFASLTFGDVAQAGLSEQFVLNDLSVVGSLAGGGGLGDVDLVYVPEPGSLAMLIAALFCVVAYGRRKRPVVA